MNRFQFIFLFAFFFYSYSSNAQSFEEVLPNLQGQDLLDNLALQYRPTVVLEYGPARDTLYTLLAKANNDSLRCIYSDHALYLDPTQDPTQYVYQNGGMDGINAEHAYPQSKGASTGNPRSDMHHLFPARIPVNEARASLPFNDIPDAQTEKWFYKNTVITSIPSINKNAYTEYKANQFFEPREASKGDIARAILYFYTVYRPEADGADPNFFASQRPTLCQWQAQDPATPEELAKTWRIAAYQENKPNPFILDCTLAFRTFCPEIAPNCTIGATAPYQTSLDLRIVPQPFVGNTQLEMTLPFAGDVQGFVRSAAGQELARFEQKNIPAGTFRWALALEGKSDAVGFLEVHFMGKNGQRVSQVLPLLGF
jgi:endonuclease I